MTSHVLLEKVLVTHVQTTGVSQQKKEKDANEDASKPDPAPNGALLVTLAVDASSVERVVFAAEFGKLWLSAQPADAPGGGTGIETRKTVYGR